jgi:hypothetical protein
MIARDSRFARQHPVSMESTMSEKPADHAAARREDAQPDEPVRYPTNHVLAVLDTEEQLTAAVEALIGGGFLDSEVHVRTGTAAADRLNESTGRGGLAGLAVRIAERLGIEDDEMANKDEYERALRDGRFLLRVATPTEEQKERASQILHEHGAHMVRFFGRFTIEDMRASDSV